MPEEDVGHLLAAGAAVPEGVPAVLPQEVREEGRVLVEDLVPRPPQPDDLYRVVVPIDPSLSPDGGTVAFTVKASAPANDGYRQSVWSAPTDGSAPGRIRSE